MEKVKFVCEFCEEKNEINAPKFQTGAFSCKNCKKDNVVSKE